MVEFASVPVIVTIVYVVMAMLKHAFGNERFNRFIPLISCVFGIGFGVIAFFCVPDVMPTDNIFVAIVLGASSGLSATGFHQIIKQLKN